MSRVGMHTEISHLKTVHRTLHLLHHRNRNQHRRAHFWKWLSMTKRCVGSLITELEANDKSRSEARILYIKDIILPNCYA